MHPHVDSRSPPLILLLLLLLLPFTTAQASSSSKRGLIYISSSTSAQDSSLWTSPSSDLTWYYNYSPTPTPQLANSKLQFVPMLFGAPSSSSDSTPFNETVVQLMQGGANISYVLAFNEPDGSPATGGSSMLASTAAQLWISQVEPLKAKGVRLGGPAVTSAQTGFEWLVNFFAACDGGCSVDFLPIHYYGDFQGLASHIGQVRAAYQNVSLWVTEFGYPNVGLQDAQTFFNQSEQYLDRLDYIERYSYFGSFRSSVSNVGPNEAMLDQNGHLTDIGSWYLGGSATGNVPGAASVTSKLATWSLTVVLFATLAVL